MVTRLRSGLVCAWLIGVFAAAGAAHALPIPFPSDGSLGAFNPSQDVLFDTDAGTYTIGANTFSGGVVRSTGSNLPATGHNASEIMQFSFTSLHIGSGITVRATGHRPLILSATQSILLEGTIDLSGSPGGAGHGGGGGGGGGGGALGLFTNSSLVHITATGKILAKGGNGGPCSEISGSTGGLGGALGAGGSAGGNGGSIAGAGNGGNGSGGVWYGGGGGGGGGGGTNGGVPGQGGQGGPGAGIGSGFGDDGDGAADDGNERSGGKGGRGGGGLFGGGAVGGTGGNWDGGDGNVGTGGAGLTGGAAGGGAGADGSTKAGGAGGGGAGTGSIVVTVHVQVPLKGGGKVDGTVKVDGKAAPGGSGSGGGVVTGAGQSSVINEGEILTTGGLFEDSSSGVSRGSDGLIYVIAETFTNTGNITGGLTLDQQGFSSPGDLFMTGGVGGGGGGAPGRVLCSQPDGGACNDGNPCTQTDTCHAGQCLGSNPVTVGTPCGSPSANACTAPDTCNSFGACDANNQPRGTACGSSSSSECDAPDSCDGGGACQANHLPDGTACTSDGNSCTNDVCGGGVCVHPTVPAPIVTGLRIAANKHAISWDPVSGSGPYDCLYGYLEILHSSGLSPAVGGCLADNLSTAAADDTDTPSTGQGFFYLSRSRGCGGTTGTYDEGGSQIQPRDPHIPAPPVDCSRP